MKTEIGKIVITNKVYFEPEGLEKPREDDYWIGSKSEYLLLMEEYEASKQLIEVSNVTWGSTKEWIWIYSSLIKGIKLTSGEVENNIPCKAEVNGTAKIIELL